MTRFLDWTFEELGANGDKSLDVRIFFNAFPGEEKTWDTPASLPHGEIEEVEALTWGNESAIQILPRCYGEQQFLNKIGEKLVEDNWLDIFSQWAEHYAPY